MVSMWVTFTSFLQIYLFRLPGGEPGAGGSRSANASAHVARRGDWMLSFDLQDGYHHVGVARDHISGGHLRSPPPFVSVRKVEVSRYHG